MSLEEKDLKLKLIVEKTLSCNAHNLDYVMRVYSLCLNLAINETSVGLDVLRAAALLHDIAKTNEDKDPFGTTNTGSEMVKYILRNLEYPKEKIDAICNCIATYRCGEDNKPKTIEAKILFDADKLDMLGAIGVARLFLITGNKSLS